jgi:HTH-type transcriptional regulator, glycine betaine synthesis regulator
MCVFHVFLKLRDAMVELYPSPTPDPVLREVEEHFGAFFEHFGFRRNLGRVWAALYTNPRPLDQAELGRHLNLSAGLISASLRELEQIGAVRHTQAPGRRLLYEAEPRLIRTVSTILARRDLEAVRTLRRAVVDVKARFRHPDDPAGFEHKLGVVEDMAELYELMARLVIRVAGNPESGLSRLVRLLRAVRSWLPRANPIAEEAQSSFFSPKRERS